MADGRRQAGLHLRALDEGILSDLGTKDATFGVFTMDSGAIWSMNICWALPKEWPGAVYGLEIGIWAPGAWWTSRTRIATW